MSSIVKKLPKSEVEIEITLPFQEFEPHVKRAAVLISEESEIEGFRRGRAPYDIVKNKFGEAEIYEKAAEVAVRKTYPKILEEQIIKFKEAGKKFIPIGKPEVSVTKLAPGNEFQYKAKIALIPEVALPDYKTISQRTARERKEISVSEEEVNKALEWFQESRSSLITVDRAAEKGNSVEVDFEIRQGGVKIQNGESKNHPLIIGKNQFIPGFEEELIGMSRDDEKSFTLAMPQDFQDKSIAGRVLDFRVKMNLVQERRLPELNEEFIRGISNFDSLEGLKANIRAGFTQEKGDKEKQRVRGRIIEEIAKETKIEIPDVLINIELDKMMSELKSGIEQMGLKWDDYLLHIKKTQEDLSKDWIEEAERRVSYALCLREIARAEKIEVSDNEVEEKANKILATYSNIEEAKKSVDPVELREYARGIVRNERVFELLEIASEAENF